mmetsp:Transcript_85459/g.242295  ORF Transcript_85459/g.242295 Transcript_85459/m.242295 type:complete len:207 (+) Transcript_85459:59-679(+)
MRSTHNVTDHVVEKQLTPRVDHSRLTIMEAVRDHGIEVVPSRSHVAICTKIREGVRAEDGHPQGAHRGPDDAAFLPQHLVPVEVADPLVVQREWVRVRRCYVGTVVVKYIRGPPKHAPGMLDARPRKFCDDPRDALNPALHLAVCRHAHLCADAVLLQILSIPLRLDELLHLGVIEPVGTPIQHQDVGLVNQLLEQLGILYRRMVR